MTICESCGDEQTMDLLEVWPEERAWMFETCCEDYHQSLLEDLRTAAEMPPLERIKYLEPLRSLFAGYGVSLRQAFLSAAECDVYRLDFGLKLETIDRTTAKQFVTSHHRHNKAPVSWKWGHAIYNGGELVSSAMVGRPVARMIDHATTVEVTRLTTDHSKDPELTWNASSMLYGAAAREAKRRGFKKIITYTLETESGHSLKAAGWIPEARTKGGSWNRPSRTRGDHAPTCRKIRWAKYLEEHETDPSEALHRSYGLAQSRSHREGDSPRRGLADLPRSVLPRERRDGLHRLRGEPAQSGRADRDRGDRRAHLGSLVGR